MNLPFARDRIYASCFPGGNYPARSALGANGLALGARVELDCIAAEAVASYYK